MRPVHIALLAAAGFGGYWLYKKNQSTSSSDSKTADASKKEIPGTVPMQVGTPPNATTLRALTPEAAASLDKELAKYKFKGAQSFPGMYASVTGARIAPGETVAQEDLLISRINLMPGLGGTIFVPAATAAIGTGLYSPAEAEVYFGNLTESQELLKVATEKGWLLYKNAKLPELASI